MNGDAVGPMRAAYDVFLCHNNRDKETIKVIDERLIQEFEFRTFFDESELIGGEDWDARIRASMDASRTCAIILGPTGWGPYQLDREAVPALARQKADPSFRVIPVLLPGVDQREMLRLDEFFTSSQWVDFREDWEDTFAIYRLVAAIKGEKAFPVGKPELTPTRVRFDSLRYKTWRDKSILYSGRQLREAQAIRERLGTLDGESQAFLAQSEWRQRRILTAIVASLAIGILSLSYLAYRASVGESAAKRQTAIAEKNLFDLERERAAADYHASHLAWEASDRDSSLLYAVRADESAETASDPLAPSYAVWASQLARTFPQFTTVLPGDIWNVLFAPDGTKIKISAKETNQVWSVGGDMPQMLADLPIAKTGSVSFFSYSRSGNHLLGQLGHDPRTRNWIVWGWRSGDLWNVDPFRAVGSSLKFPESYILTAYPSVVEAQDGKPAVVWAAANDVVAVGRNGKPAASSFQAVPVVRQSRLPRVPRLIVSGNTGNFVDLATGEMLGEVEAPAGAKPERWSLTKDAKYAAVVWRSGGKALLCWGKLGERSPKYSTELDTERPIDSIDLSEAPRAILLRYSNLETEAAGWSHT
jgi:hypothetical protein